MTKVICDFACWLIYPIILGQSNKSESEFNMIAITKIKKISNNGQSQKNKRINKKKL